MAIEFRLDEMIEQHGRTAYWLSQQTGIAESALWRIRHGRTKGIQWRTLERICDALGCEPGDLIVRVPDPKRASKRKAKK